MKNKQLILKHNESMINTFSSFEQHESHFNTSSHSLLMHLDRMSTLMNAIFKWRFWNDIEIIMKAQIILEKNWEKTWQWISDWKEWVINMIIWKLRTHRQMKQVMYKSFQCFYYSHSSKVNELKFASFDFKKIFFNESSETQTTDEEEQNSLNQFKNEFVWNETQMSKSELCNQESDE